MFKQVKTHAMALALVPASFLFAGAANAAAVDVSGIVSDIGAQAAPIAAIGGAVLLVYVGIKAFKWVRQAL